MLFIVKINVKFKMVPEQKMNLLVDIDTLPGFLTNPLAICLENFVNVFNQFLQKKMLHFFQYTEKQVFGTRA